MRYGIVSRHKAENDYGVILTADNEPDTAATETKRVAMRDKRGPAPAFDFGFEPPVRDAAE